MDFLSFLPELSVYNIITIVLIVLFILSSVFLKVLRNVHDRDPAFQEKQRKKREAYEKRIKEEEDDLIARANSGMDMGDEISNP